MWNDSMKMLKSFVPDMLENKYPDQCPECGSLDRHVFIYRFDEDDDGGLWMWCSKCHNYTHAHIVVPVGWRNPDFIDEDRLEDSVEYLEERKHEIDKWVNSLEK